MSKVAIFASGAGSNADRIFHFLNEYPSSIEVDCVLTNKKGAGIYEVAKTHGVPLFHFPNTDFEEGLPVLQLLKQRKVEWIVLAGFLRKVEPIIVDAYSNRIFNLHPSLLPKYGGKGMYGKNVHKAVIEGGEIESGISIHLVNNEFDKGEVILQAKCSVEKGQTVEELAEKIQKLEHQFFPKTIVQHINGVKQDN